MFSDDCQGCEEMHPLFMHFKTYHILLTEGYKEAFLSNERPDLMCIHCNETYIDESGLK